MTDSKSPYPSTKALLSVIPQFESDFGDEQFSKGIAEVFLWQLKFSPPKKEEGADQEKLKQINLLSQKLEHQQEVFSSSITEQITKVAELREALLEEGHTSGELRQQVQNLEEKNADLKSKVKTLHMLHMEKDKLIEQIKEQCQKLQESINARPSEEKLLQFIRESNINTIDLLDTGKFKSLDELSNFKSQIKRKIIERKEKLKLEKKEEEETALKNKEAQLDKYREIVMCPICMDHTKNTIFVPCGHAFCAKCSGTILNSNSGRCPICRVDVDSQHTFYL